MEADSREMTMRPTRHFRSRLRDRWVRAGLIVACLGMLAVLPPISYRNAASIATRSLPTDASVNGIDLHWHASAGPCWRVMASQTWVGADIPHQVRIENGDGGYEHMISMTAFYDIYVGMDGRAIR